MNILFYMRWMLLVAMGLVLMIEALSAQSNDNRSPYSRYGYGSLAPQATAGSRAMGGLSFGLRDGMISNPGNPASYTAVDSLTFIFDVGASTRYAFLSESGRSDHRLLGNLEYITMLFPLGKRMAMSAGIMPLSTTGYSFGSYATMGGDSNDSKYLRSYSGQGSYNNIYLGVAGRVLGGLHLGVNASYVFGHNVHYRNVTYTTPGALNTVSSRRLHLQGYKFDFGAQYVFELDTTGIRSLVIGASITPGFGFKNEYTRLSQVISNNTTETKLNVTTTDGSYTMPLMAGFGVSYRVANKYMIGADAQYRKWSDAKYTDLEAQFSDQWRIALGGEFTPDARARSPFKRAKYRFGLSGGTSYLHVPLSSGSLTGYYELGASIGLSLPLVDRRSSIQLSIDYKHLAPRATGMVREQYIGATIGITFNESWFRKAQVN